MRKFFAVASFQINELFELSMTSVALCAVASLENSATLHK